MFTVYILRTNKNTLYIGQTSNLERRMMEHKSGKKGAKYMKYFGSFELVYTEEFKTRSESLKREYQLKQLPRFKKDALIKSK